MPFAHIGGSGGGLKTADELDLMLGCIDNDTEVVHDDKLVTPPIDAKYVVIIVTTVIVVLYRNHTINVYDRHIYNTHTHTFNGPLSGTNRVSRYQKGKTSLDFSKRQ